MGGDGTDLEFGVRGENAQEFATCVPARPSYCNGESHAVHPRPCHPHRSSTAMRRGSPWTLEGMQEARRTLHS
ncbi:hypothetical protein ACFPRL_05755 [Pseudoclavibacter helvolus]